MLYLTLNIEASCSIVGLQTNNLLMRSYYWYYDNLKYVPFQNLLSEILAVDVVSEKLVLLNFHGFWTCVTVVLSYLWVHT